MFKASPNLKKYAQAMSEYYIAMKNATDDESRDFNRCEYETNRERYKIELARLDES